MTQNPSKLQQRRDRLMPGGVPRYVRCYDNGGRTLDRYTVVFTGNYPDRDRGRTEYLTMSANPFWAQGVCMGGEVLGYMDRPSYSHLGKKITFADLPANCQKAVLGYYRNMWYLDDRDSEGA